MMNDMMEDTQEAGGGYQNALSNLAAGMAGGQGNMIECPMCGGKGVCDAEMLQGAGVPSMPARLAARAPMMGAGMPSGAVPMVGGPMRAPMMS
jgi:phage/plasmid primase-like uncharacterized protein